MNSYLRTKRAGARRAYRPYLKYFEDWRAERDLAEIELADYLNGWLWRPEWASATRYLAHCAVRDYVAYLGQPEHPIALHREPRKKSPKQRALTEKQFLKIVGAIDTSHPKGRRDVAIVSLAFDTGLRVSELCRLTLANLDLEGQQVTVERKGGDVETSVFSDVTRSYLASWLVDRRYLAKEHEAVFCSIGGSTPGNPLTRDGLRVVIRNLGRAVGIALSPHDIRRGHAAMAHLRGAPVHLSMRQGGWSDQQTFQRYTSHALNVEQFRPYFPTNCLIEQGGDPETKVKAYA